MNIKCLAAPPYGTNCYILEDGGQAAVIEPHHSGQRHGEIPAGAARPTGTTEKMVAAELNPPTLNGFIRDCPAFPAGRSPVFSPADRHMGFRFRLSRSTIQAIRLSRPACVFASKYARA